MECLRCQAPNRAGQRFRGECGAALPAPQPAARERRQVIPAALAIQEGLPASSDEIKRCHGVDLQLRLGVNTGLVLAGGKGDGESVEYTALSDTINLAARLESSARPGGVLVGDATRRAAGQAFHWARSDPSSSRARRNRSPPGNPWASTTARTASSFWPNGAHQLRGPPRRTRVTGQPAATAFPSAEWRGASSVENDGFMERMLASPEGLLVGPDRLPTRCAALVLAGSSGRVETDRVRLLADRGAAAMSIRWFGGPGQSSGICEVPLETFSAALDRLARFSDHLVIVGISKGAEAALLVASRDQRVGAVAALSPSSVVWANVGPGIDGRMRPQRSSWTESGLALPFVRYDDGWTPLPDRQTSYRTLYEQSLVTFADDVPAATIPVERIEGPVLVSAGDDDQVWPSERFARDIAQRRQTHRLDTRVVIGPAAGHRVQLPGEPPIAPRGAAMERGGGPKADAEVGRQIWPQLLELMHLD